ncbi:MAG: HAMP domain-containing histidine kinase [Lachnospiraceae bacterium]|nr:HAMP domain-containing histidine kinase [Lachnospiraceae bacterium]MBP5670566.1 HAMP domain-containing histidine kinase [Lachnospiraceae bacterium]MBP5732512.1 HAMP domain-containing histidine kinase [Lachnospiraceae bacterium]
MLRKLKIKFIFAIMTLVTVIYVLIFCALLLFTKMNLERNGIQMMRGLSFAPRPARQISPPGNAPDGMNVPVFSVERSESGKLTAQGSDFYDLSDTDKLSRLVEAASTSEKPVGVLREYDLRYLRTGMGNVERFVFADVSAEKMMFRGLIRNLLIIGLISYVVFFLISLVMAQWVTKPVEKAWNAQRQFVADASHELKTPLTVIMTNAEMLTDEGYAKMDRGNLANNILFTSKRMKNLVESLLELARLDNGHSEIKAEPVDYSLLLNNCILPFEPLFFENHQELSCEIEKNVTVTGDPEKLRQVVTILLDNSLKYGDTGESVIVSLRQQSHNCVLSVSSKGAPLSKEDCKNVFKRFYRTDPARNDGHSYGLGLSIAESIVTEHHGRIWAESQDGRNTFFVSLKTRS